MIKFFLILFILFFLFRLVMPYIFKWAIKAFIKKNIPNGTFTSVNQSPFSPPNQPDGNIKVNYVPKDKKPKPKDFPGGEYVDYEEVK